MPTSDAMAAGEDEFNNALSYRTSYFNNDPLLGSARPQISGLALETEIYLDLYEKIDFTFKSYFQYTYLNEDEGHQDIRELFLRYKGDSWEIGAGIGQEFWGVTESRNLVDIINQNDFIAGFTGDAKLGQPMVKGTYFSPVGNFSVYYLPLFREPKQPGSDSRPRRPWLVNDATTYESEKDDKQADFALRWTHNISVWDVGVHYFNGTQRNPALTQTPQGFTSEFIQVQRFGIDTQATTGSLLSKFEYVFTVGERVRNHWELVGGFEYTFFNPLDTDIELGFLAEYLYDSRTDQADQAFEGDLLAGVRMAFNDANSTEFLLTQIRDMETKGDTIQLDLSRRVGSDFKVSLQGSWWKGVVDDPFMGFLENEDNLEFNLYWYF